MLKTAAEFQQPSFSSRPELRKVAVNCVNGVKCIIMHTLSVICIICIIMPIMREHPGRFPEPTRVLAHNWYNFAIYTNNAGGVRNNVGGVRN
jgi:hypothetical protein